MALIDPFKDWRILSTDQTIERPEDIKPALDQARAHQFAEDVAEQVRADTAADTDAGVQAWHRAAYCED